MIIEKRLILIVAKSPLPGRAKTRLVQEGRSPEEAALLAHAFLQDTLALCADARLRANVYLALDGDPVDVADLAPSAIVPQVGNDLGSRLQNLFAHAFADGFTKVVAVGADTPHLPLAFLIEAFGWLSARPAPDVVLGPSDDGGYYLVGMARPLPMLFEQIAWGSEAVFRQTMAQAEMHGLKSALLPPWYDIDTPSDLLRLQRDFRSGLVKLPHSAALFDFKETK